jgi:hypothetical protein
MRDPVATADDGRRALEIALAGYISGTTGRTVELPLPVDHPVYQQGINGLRAIDAWPQSKTLRARIFGLMNS